MPPQQLQCHVISSQWEAVKNRFLLFLNSIKNQFILQYSKGYGLATGSGNVMVGYNSGGGCETGSKVHHI